MKSLYAIIAGVAIACLLTGCPDSSDDSDDNAAPMAVDDAASTAMDTPVTVDVTANDTDDDGDIDPATVTLVTDPIQGTATVDAATGAVTYTPDAGVVGDDDFTYTVADNDGDTSNAATVTITVTAAGLDFVELAQQVFAAGANDAPIEVNALVIQNQFDPGDPLPIDAFLP